MINNIQKIYKQNKEKIVLMKKRGQIGQVMKYALIAVVIVFIQIFGYKAFVTVREKMCQTEIADFVVDLKGLDEGIGFGSVDERTLLTPCNVDKIYFFDLDKDINVDIFNKLPIMKDSLESGVKKNLFLVKDDEVKRSFYSGNLELSYPYFECLVPQNERINFFLEGRGRAVEVIPGCNQIECSYVPEVLGLDKADAIAESISFRDSGDCGTAGGTSVQCHVNSDIKIEVKKAIETMANVNIFRKYQYCPDSGIAKVEIVVIPKEGRIVENFRLFEYIPKDCVGDLSETILEFTATEGNAVKLLIKDDPLIMWHFDELDKEEKVSYELKIRFNEEDCKKVIDSIGIADKIEEQSVESIVTDPLYETTEMPEEFRSGGESELDDIVEDVEDVLVLSISDQTLNSYTVGFTYSNSISFSGTPISITIISGSLHSDLILNSPSGVISGTPASSEGNSVFTVELDDGVNPRVSAQITIPEGAVANNPPTLALSPSTFQTVTAGNSISITVIPSDLDAGDTLTMSSPTGYPGGETVTWIESPPGTWTFTWNTHSITTPIGTNTITFEVNDNKGEPNSITTATIQIEVTTIVTPLTLNLPISFANLDGTPDGTPETTENVIVDVLTHASGGTGTYTGFTVSSSNTGNVVCSRDGNDIDCDVLINGPSPNAATITVVVTDTGGATIQDTFRVDINCAADGVTETLSCGSDPTRLYLKDNCGTQIAYHPCGTGRECSADTPPSCCIPLTSNCQSTATLPRISIS